MEDTATATIDPPATQAPDSFNAPNPFTNADSLLDPLQPQDTAPAVEAPPPSEDDDDPPAPEQQPTTDGQAQAEKPKRPWKSRTELAKELDEERKRFAEYQQQAEERQKQRELAEQRAKDLEEQVRQRDELYRKAAVPKYDPQADPEVGGVLNQLRDSFNDVAAELDAANRDALSKNWWQEVHGFEKHKAEMNLKTFRESLAERYPGEDTDAIYRMIRESVPKIREVEAKRAAREASYGEMLAKSHDERRRKAVEYVSKFGARTDAEIAEAPDDAQSIISLMARTSPKLKEQITALGPKFANLLAGNPPLPADASPEALIQHRRNDQELEAMRAAAPMLFFERPILTRALQEAMAELEVLRKRVGAASDAKAPGATFTPEATPKAKTGDPAGWDAPNPYV